MINESIKSKQLLIFRILFTKLVEVSHYIDHIQSLEQSPHRKNPSDKFFVPHREKSIPSAQTDYHPDRLPNNLNFTVVRMWSVFVVVSFTSSKVDH